MEERDYYGILGVPEGASFEEIRSAFRRLALRYHPDKNPNDPTALEKFRLITEAYSVLSDPARRAEYDRKLAERRKRFERRAEAWDGHRRYAGFRSRRVSLGELLDKVTIRIPKMRPLNFNRVLSSVFRSLRLRRRAEEWSPGDVTIEVSLTMKEAAEGVRKIVEVLREEICPECGGSGRTRYSRLDYCTRCAGTGHVFSRQGDFMVSQRCPVCDGTGRILVNPCPSCRGKGVREVPRRIAVRIPPGVRDGTRLRLRGQGGRGDLFIVVRVREEDGFLRRVGDDVYCEIDISFVDAALGGEVEVRTIDGRAKLKIPPGTQSGTILRMRGKGFPRGDGTRGDQLVKVNVVIPKNLTPEQRKLLEQLRRSGGIK